MAKKPANPFKERRKQPLCSCIRTSLDGYFRDLEGHKASNIYDLVLKEVEKPLFEAVMQYAEGNQTRAAEVLGINRSTLRKKLDQYRIKL